MTPSPTREVRLDLPGICGRTPEVQVSIMQALAVDGPRMSCSSIDAAELYRLRRLLVRADRLLPGDFHDLPSLRELEVLSSGSPLPPGVFAGMPSLLRLELDLSHRRGDDPLSGGVFSPGTFDGLEGLERLEVNARAGRVRLHLDVHNLRGLSGLRELDVDSVALVTPGALHGMPKLERVRFIAAYTPAYARDQAPRLPPELFDSLPSLERVQVRHFRREGG